VLTLARGKLLELQGDLPGADAAFGRAAVLARRGSRRLVLAHALLLLARLKRRRRDHGAARALAREARVVLDTCPDPGILGGLLTRTERTLQLRASHAAAPVPADLELSERALQLASAPRATAEQLPADVELSERELTVLRLLASELSQREIGSELYVSLNTVKAHTQHLSQARGLEPRRSGRARSRARPRLASDKSSCPRRDRLDK